MSKIFTVALIVMGAFSCIMLRNFLHVIHAGPEVYSALRALFLVMAASGIAGIIFLSVRGGFSQ